MGQRAPLHLTRPLREFIEANSGWLTAFQPPPYAPDLNPQEHTWSPVKRDTGNLAAADLTQITTAVSGPLSGAWSEELSCRS